MASAAPIRSCPAPVAVVIHPFKREVDDDAVIVTLCDPHDPELAGWSVYVRIEDNGSCADAEEIGDFTHPITAIEKAYAVANERGLPVWED